jgi:hypothetical protein
MYKTFNSQLSQKVCEEAIRKFILRNLRTTCNTGKTSCVIIVTYFEKTSKSLIGIFFVTNNSLACRSLLGIAVASF